MNKKVKTIVGMWTEESFDRKVNAFLDNPNIEVLEINFATPLFIYAVMIVYVEKKCKCNEPTIKMES